MPGRLTKRQLSELAAAARRKDFARVKDVVAQLDVIDPDDTLTIEAFVYCGLSKDLRLVHSFLNRGINVNSVCRGNSILHLAARIPFPAFVGSLLKLGVLPNARDAEGATPLILVSRQGYDFNSPDVRKAYLRTARQLINAGADVDVADIYRRTALDYSSAANWYELARLLLQNGGRVTKCDERGMWALKAACEQPDDLRLLRLLLKHGADPSRRLGADKNHSLVRYVSEHGWVEATKLLIAAGAPKKLPDGTPALEIARSCHDTIKAVTDQLFPKN